jgi:hypothetical protein
MESSIVDVLILPPASGHIGNGAIVVAHRS